MNPFSGQTRTGKGIIKKVNDPRLLEQTDLYYLHHFVPRVKTGE